jgi:hypothetical protein
VPDIKDTGFDFLKAEVHTGLTLAQIAADTHKEDRGARNRKNARTAYDTAQRTMRRLPLAAKQAAEISALLRQLRKKLEELGEKFDGPEGDGP